MAEHTIERMKVGAALRAPFRLAPYGELVQQHAAHLELFNSTMRHAESTRDAAVDAQAFHDQVLAGVDAWREYARMDLDALEREHRN